MYQRFLLNNRKEWFLAAWGDARISMRALVLRVRIVVLALAIAILIGIAGSAKNVLA